MRSRSTAVEERRLAARLALAGLFLAALLFFPQTALAGKRCPSVDAGGMTLKVGIGGGVSCEKAQDVIQRFYRWYESQPGHKQRRRIDNFLCGRASGTLSCRSKPRWIYADSHMGAEPWTLPSPWAKPKKPPFLGRNAAKHWMRVALRREFGSMWSHRVGGEVKCTKRLRRNRIRCQRINWGIGDFFYWGAGTIWYRRQHGEVWWHYSFRIRRLDEYCAFVQERPPRECIKKFVVR